MHSFATVVRLQHTDAAGVVFFARLFDLAHLAFEDLLDRIGHSLPAALASAEVAYPVVQASAEYRAPLRLGDRIRIDVVLEELTEQRFGLAYRVVLASGVLAANARMVHRAASAGIRTGAALPSALADALRAVAAPEDA